ncbi:MAG: ABC transporter ATP-binding protein, partial [Nanoarchaeota archaeon]|nr:ABC transporter ATP-binding protein [Nanoarchaeota archaeon]
MKLLSKYKKLLKDNQRIVQYFKPYWKIWLIIIVIANILTLLELANPLIVKFLIDVVLLEKNYKMLNLLMFAFIGIGMASVVIQYVYGYLQKRLSLSILFDVRNELFHHIENLDTKEVHDKTLGDFLSRITDDIEAIGEYTALIFQTLLMNVLMVVIIFAMAIMLHWQLTLISMLIIPFVVYSQKHYGKKVSEIFEGFRIIDASFLNFLQERLTLLPLIKTFSREKHELDKEKKKAKELIKTD